MKLLTKFKTIIPALFLSTLLSYSPLHVNPVPQHANIEQQVELIEKKENKKLELSEIRGIYLHSWKSRNQEQLDEIIQNMKKTGLNAVVVDIKSNAGEILYKTLIPLAKEIESQYPALGNLEYFIKKFHDQDIYFIARQVVFNDPILVKSRPGLAIRDQSGKVWKGEMSNYFVPWVDPHSEDVNNYNLSILEEVCKAGIDEIQFDYIRFPACKNLIYPHQNELSKLDVLKNFLDQAWLIARDYDVKVGIDIFGFSILNKGDLGIGHSFSELLDNIDVISPMLYPSHYSPGNFGFEMPQNHPFHIISESTKLANEMAKEKGVVVRPWIQAFPWNTPNYCEDYIAEEILGVWEGGSTSYLVWNANNNYKKLFDAIQNNGINDVQRSLKIQESLR